MSDPNSRQVGGDHYVSQFQHWDFVKLANMPYLEAQVLRYVTREKNGLEDIQKALHFCEKLIAERERNETMADQYSAENQLSDSERMVVLYAVRGDLFGMRQVLEGLAEGFLPLEEPVAQGYVDQDQEPPAHAGTYSWKCKHCEERLTVPATFNGQKTLESYMAGHKGCAAFHDTQPVST